MDKICIFCESTLNQSEILAIIPQAIIKPSIRKGDVLVAMRDGFQTIVIVDGVFSNIASVWHKEILYALESGVRIVGVSSMGALRASELYQFGMIGYGKIFNLYRDNVIDDDSEVAVMFNSVNNQVHSTIPFANFRLSLEGYSRKNIVLSALKTLHYSELSWQNVETILNEQDLEYLKTHYVDYKKQDALNCLKSLATLQSPVLKIKVPYTIFLKHLVQETFFADEFEYYLDVIRNSGFSQDHSLTITEVDKIVALQIKLLLGAEDNDLDTIQQIVAYIRHSQIKLEPSHVISLVKQFRTKLGILNGADFKQWCAVRSLDLECLENTFLHYFLLKRMLVKTPSL